MNKALSCQDYLGFLDIKLRLCIYFA